MLIRRLMIKLGIIKVEDDKAKLKSKIHLELGGAVDIFNAIEVGSQANYLVFMKNIKSRDSIMFTLLVIEVKTHFESTLLLKGKVLVLFFLEVT
jgi:hypothetical protein